MFDLLISSALRLLLVSAALLNTALGAALAAFMIRPASAMRWYLHAVGWGSPDFVRGLLSPSWSSSWADVFMVANLAWLTPFLFLGALALLGHGVSSGGALRMESIATPRGNFGFTQGSLPGAFITGIVILVMLGVAAAGVLTSDGFETFLEKRGAHDFSIGGAIEGYRNLARGVVGIKPATAEPPPSSPASARSNHG